MIFVFNKEDGSSKLPPMLQSSTFKEHVESLAGMILERSIPIDVQATAKRFRDKLGDEHPATKFWSFEGKAYLSDWNPPDPWPTMIDQGMAESMIYAPDKVPWIWDDNAYVVSNGSRLYGLDDEHSDWDTTIISDSFPVRTSILDPSTKAFLKRNVLFNANRGNRHTLEAIFAPASCVLSEGDKANLVADVRRIVKLMIKPHRVLSWHRQYVRRYLPVAENRADLHDRFVTQWVAKAGWPYKVGYFLLIDAMITKFFFSNGSYELRAPFEDDNIRAMMLKCKHGLMTQEEWRNVFDTYRMEKDECSSM